MWNIFIDCYNYFYHETEVKVNHNIYYCSIKYVDK